MTDARRPNPVGLNFDPDGNLRLSARDLAELLTAGGQQPFRAAMRPPGIPATLPHPAIVRHDANLLTIATELDALGFGGLLADPEFGERQISEHIRTSFGGHPQPVMAQWGDPYRALYAAACLSHARRGGAILRATDALETLLSHTDIDASLPTSMFVPPCPALYLHFGARWQARIRSLMGPALALTDASPDDVTPHGCYLLQTRYFCDSCSRNQRNIGLYVVTEFHDQPGFYALAGGADEVLHDEDAPLRDTLVRKLDSGVPNGLLGKMPAVLVDILAKLFLYMQTETARVVPHDEHTALLQRLSAVGSKKQGKLERRAERLYDWQEVGPAQLPAGCSGHGHDGDALMDEISPHWRRGHLRHQAHGPNHSLRKVIFIAPTLVRADRLATGPSGGAA